MGLLKDIRNWLSLSKTTRGLLNHSNDTVKVPRTFGDCLSDYPELAKNIHSIAYFLKTQDLPRMIKGSDKEELGLVALGFIQSLLQDRSISNRILSDTESKAFRAIELAIGKIKKDGNHSKYKESQNPLMKVLANWCEMDWVLDSILEDDK